MANKHICCLKPRRCSVCKIQMRCRSDTLCEIAGATEQLENTHLLPHWTGKLVCMGGEPCCGRCIVLCRVKEEQQTHFMNYWKNRPGKGKNAAWPLLVDWTCGLHGIQFPASNRWRTTYNLHLRHTGEHECDILWLHLMASTSLKTRTGPVTSVVDKVLLWENTHLFCLFEAPNWTFAYLPEQYVNSTCTTFSYFTPEGFRAQSQS